MTQCRASSRGLVWFLAGILGGASGATGSPHAPVSDQSQPDAVLVLDQAAQPSVAVSWDSQRGQPRRYELSSLAWGTPEERTPIGGNLTAYVAVGGTRVKSGAGFPDALTIRVGLHKIDAARPLFPGIRSPGVVELELRGVRFEGPAVGIEESLLQHMTYAADDVLSCGLPLDNVDMFNFASWTDTLNNQITATRARWGVIGTSEDPTENAAERGDARIVTEADGSLTLRVVFPYRLLRHKLDPWGLETPGTFFEPQSFHVEFEAVTPEVALTQFGIEPSR